MSSAQLPESKPLTFVPTLDLQSVIAGPLDDLAAQRTLARIRSACAETGFMVVTGHGIAPSVFADGERAARKFFALSTAQKIHAAPQRWNPSSTNVYRGYFPSSADGKEGLDLGDPLIEPGMHDLRRFPFLEPNRLPTELGPAWHAAIEQYYDAFFTLGCGIVRAMVASLGGNPGRADAGFVRPNSTSTLRFNAYSGSEMPQEVSDEDGEALSCEAHVDSGLITILYQCDLGGLQVRDRSGDWHNIDPSEGRLVVNTGRALQLAFGGAFAATSHRVLYTASPRLSIPFFFEPGVELPLAPQSFGLDVATDQNPISYADFLAHSLEKFPEYDR